MDTNNSLPSEQIWLSWLFKPRFTAASTLPCSTQLVYFLLDKHNSTEPTEHYSIERDISSLPNSNHSTKMNTPLTEANYALLVDYIRVIIEVPETGHESDTYSGSHPSIYLLTNDDGSVRLNMSRAKPEDTMGTYAPERCSYRCIDYPLKVVDLSAVKGLTVGDVTRLIEGKGRDRYELVVSGTGCRFWV